MKTIKSISFNDRQLQMIEDLKERKGLSTLASVIHFALAICHAKAEPAYLSIGKKNMTPEERAKFSVDVKLAKTKHAKELVFAKKKQICEAVLGGEVFTDSSGGNSCRFYVYDTEKDEEQILPLESVNESYAKHQFYPDRETVLKERPELRKKFNVK
jgi:hypothetical protein